MKPAPTEKNARTDSTAPSLRFSAVSLALDGLVLLERLPRFDERGSFSRVFCAADLASAGWDAPIAQINYSHTRKAGTIRGLHFQRPPHAEKKLVVCLRGRIWDAVVDLRANSPTFLQWCGRELDAYAHQAMLVPEGCAHGFQTLTDDVELLYIHSAPFSPQAEGGLHPQDPQLKIEWPLEITEISDRDAQCQLLDAAFEGFKL